MSDQGEFWGPEPRDRSVTYGSAAVVAFALLVITTAGLGLGWAVYSATMALLR